MDRAISCWLTCIECGGPMYYTNHQYDHYICDCGVEANWQSVAPVLQWFKPSEADADAECGT